MSFDYCFKCEKRVAEKTDSNGDPVCIRCLLGVVDPIRGTEKIPRNSPCLCGSGIKYKKCCRGKD